MVKIRPPEHRHLSHVCRDVQKNYAVVFVNTNLAGAQMKIGLGRIMRGEDAAIDEVGVLADFDRSDIVTAQKIR